MSKDISKKLLQIQQNLKAPKSQYNKFGNFYHRNAEDILEAVKPLVHERDLTLILSDEAVSVSEWNYIKAIAVISDGEAMIEVSAFARETETKKGMDASQITGSASSYARKYALAGLFAIDDTKDADTHDNTEEPDVAPAKEDKDEPASIKQKLKIRELLKENKKIERDDMPAYLEKEFGLIPGVAMLNSDASDIIASLEDQSK